MTGTALIWNLGAAREGEAAMSGLLLGRSPGMTSNINDLAPPAWAVAGILPEQGVRLSEVVSALSYALDITEGQREGHAVRSCVIGMRIGQILPRQLHWVKLL